MFVMFRGHDIRINVNSSRLHVSVSFPNLNLDVGLVPPSSPTVLHGLTSKSNELYMNRLWLKVPSLGGTPQFLRCLLLYAFTVAGLHFHGRRFLLRAAGTMIASGGGSNYRNDVYVSPSRAVFLRLGALLGDPPSD